MNFQDRIRANRIKKEATIPAFISQWDTRNTSGSSSASNQVKLPLTTAGSYNFTVDWGDGNTDVITAYNQSEVTHTYSTEGIYTITITGTITDFCFNYGGDREKILDISKCGPLNIKTEKAFGYCYNLDFSATDSIGLVGADNDVLNYMFYDCDSLTTPPFMDTSSCLEARRMFRYCGSLEVIPHYDFSSIIEMDYFAQNCTSITSFPPLNLSSATDCTSAFSGGVIPTADYSAFLNNLDTLTLQSGVSFHAGTATRYNSSASAARANIISNHSWSFTDGGLE